MSENTSQDKSVDPVSTKNKSLKQKTTKSKEIIQSIVPFNEIKINPDGTLEEE